MQEYRYFCACRRRENYGVRAIAGVFRHDPGGRQCGSGYGAYRQPAGGTPARYFCEGDLCFPEITFAAPSGCAGRIINDVQQMRGEVTDTSADEDTVTLYALVPAASFIDYPVKYASLTGGRGSMSTSLHGYRECPLELGNTASRRGVDPLDTAKYILAARSALEGNIFDE